jgi:hypothetical protein
MLPERELAEQDLRRFLPLHLAGVNVALDVDAELAGGPDGGGARILEAGADHRHRHGASFVGGPVRRIRDDRRRGVHRLHERDHVVVCGRRLEAGRFGCRLQIGDGRVLLGVAGHDDGGQRG